MGASSTVGRWLPGLQTLRTYQRSWLPRDVVAGVVLTALLVPAGMGYAEASGLPAIYGLYATIVPLVAYAVVGPSRILVLGPDSSLAPLIAAAILPLAAGSDAEAVALAGMLAILTGVLCVLAGLARFGFIADLLSKPVRYGYMNGIALTVLLSQLPKLLGFSIDAEGAIPEARALVRGVADGQTNRAALLIGVACLLVILGCKRWRPKIPGVLVAVVGATVAVGVFGLAQRYDIWWWDRSPRGSRHSRSPASRPTTSGPSCPAPSGSPWSRSPTPACSHGPSRSEVATGSTRTRSWWRLARPTWPPVSSRDSR
jgi:MFS superfamily sulfate permease-like transporter